MKLFNTLVLGAAAELVDLDLQWNTAKETKTCAKPGFKQLRTQAPNEELHSISMTFDMTKNTEKDLLGIRASLKYPTKKKNPYKKCRPVTKKTIKMGELDDGMLTIELACPLKSLLVSEILIDSRGKNCPEYETITVQADQLVCEEGYEPNEAGDECVDIDECANDSACAGIATCTNVPGSHVCKCEGYGDGYLGCVPLTACHPGQDDADCDCGPTFNGRDFNLTLNTYWNSTEDSCTFEYTLPTFTDSPVESWNLHIMAGFKYFIEGIWRANDVEKQPFAQFHTVYPMYFNPNGLHTDLTFQLTAVDQPCILAHWPYMAENLGFQYCSMELVPVTEPATVPPVYETAPPAATAPPEPVIELGVRTCNPVLWKTTGSWENTEDGLFKNQVTIDMNNEHVMHNWEVFLGENYERIEVWNAELNDGVLVAKDYNTVIDGSSTLSMIICTSDPLVQPTAKVCYQPR